MNAASGGPDDADLVRAALAGESNAFSALMTRHKDTLYRFVRRYVGDADEAFDIVQESFVACWAALDTFDQTRAFPTWLRRIAINKCRDWGRRRKVRQFFFGAAPLSAAETAKAPEDDAGDDDVIERSLEQLDQAVAALPRALKEPLLLTVFEQLSHLEAGGVLGVSAKAIETRVYRAKQKLRAALVGRSRQRTE